MARDFTGNTDKVLFSTSPITTLTQYSFSIIMSRDSGGSGTAYGQAFQVENATPATQISWENDNGDGGWGLVFKAGWTTANGYWSVAYPGDTAYHNYVVTYDHGSTTNDPVIYKDGSSIGITERITPSGTARTTSTQLTIGNTASANLGWDGKIAELALWNRLLNSAEAALLGKGFSALFLPRGLVFYTPIIGRNSPETSRVSSATGAVTGTSTVAHPRIIYPSRPQAIFPPAATVTVNSNFFAFM